MVRHKCRNADLQREALEKVNSKDSKLGVKIIDSIFVVLLAPVDHLLKILIQALYQFPRVRLRTHQGTIELQSIAKPPPPKGGGFALVG